MPRIKPKKINYFDMKNAIEVFRIPKAKSEQIKLIKRFEIELGDNYRLDYVLDPDYDVNTKTFEPFQYDPIERKLIRIERYIHCSIRLHKAIREKDEYNIKWYKVMLGIK